MKVGIIGASGFIGAAVTEHLLTQPGLEVMPFIHSTGNAARLTRLGVSMTPLELRNRDEVGRAVRSVTHVVNCARTETPDSQPGVAHLVDACRAQRRRFVHLGSVAVYAPSASQPLSEDAPTTHPRGSFGRIKLQQDALVRRAAARGMSGVVLCLPPVSGAQSPWLTALVKAVLCGELAVLEDGAAHQDLVDIRNVVQAITLALTDGPTDGQRLFVTDGNAVTWKHILEALRPLTGDAAVPSIRREVLQRLAAAALPPTPSVVRTLCYLVSGDVREVLRRDPLWARTEAALRAFARRLGVRPPRQPWPAPAIAIAPAQRLNVALVTDQLNDATYPVTRAMELLGYRPQVRFASSMAAFQRWFRAAHAWDVPLARQLAAR